jgi:hypothetical protein
MTDDITERKQQRGQRSLVIRVIASESEWGARGSISKGEKEQKTVCTKDVHCGCAVVCPSAR